MALSCSILGSSLSLDDNSPAMTPAMMLRNIVQVIESGSEITNEEIAEWIKFVLNELEDKKPDGKLA